MIPTAVHPSSLQFYNPDYKTEKPKSKLVKYFGTQIGLETQLHE